ncbi:LytTR family DNA-binding domain-containing protein [Olsenella sp. HMSC062G07]|uniref:LytR/AlgR family response regulator transcription factor n=1 Tax=Olsenella sp. HMSC062G07 TaxID=1739330 RepID=UPI0008A4A2D3|nr:LytTR family DNA-binding domain-containing protein [Olsenella sp. HMSC062G07]OFK22162.1 DNA-binding response regulator [Olsenella sp. HMSC062G07]
MAGWNILIVDDEPPIREELRWLLSQDGRVDQIYEAGGVTRAVELIMAGGVDVVFLDISMPGPSGVRLAEFLRDFKSPPVVVFITAYAEHAAHAFDLNAADYVLKPVEASRLEQALSKVESVIRQRDSESSGRDLRIAVEGDGSRMFLLAREITYVEACGDNADVHARGMLYLAKTSLSSLEESLAEEGFLRVHKSFVVNLARIEDVRALGQGLMELTLTGEDRVIPVSRRRASQLKAALSIG